MTSTVLCTVILLSCALSLGSSQTSCQGRCGGEFYRGASCQCDYSCLSYGECCKDYESQCTTRDSCKGRCGESFKRGSLCSCDPDCMKFKQCCPDFKTSCPAEDESPLLLDSPTSQPTEELDDTFSNAFESDDLSNNGGGNPEAIQTPESSSDGYGFFTMDPLAQVSTEPTRGSHAVDITPEVSKTESTFSDDIRPSTVQPTAAAVTTKSTDASDTGKTPPQPTSAPGLDSIKPTSTSVAQVKPTNPTSTSEAGTVEQVETKSTEASFPLDEPEATSIPFSTQNSVTILENSQVTTTPPSSTPDLTTTREETTSMPNADGNSEDVSYNPTPLTADPKDPFNSVTPVASGFSTDPHAVTTHTVSSSAVNQDVSTDSVTPEKTTADPAEVTPQPTNPQKPESDPQDKPEPNPQDKPEPSPQDKPEPNPQDKPEPNPQDKPEPNPQDKPEPNPQNKPEPNPQDKPEPSPQDKPQPSPQDKPEPNPQDKPEPNPQDKPGPNPQDKPEPNPQDKPQPSPQDKPEPNPQDKPEPNPQDKPGPNPQDKPEPNPQDKPQPSPQDKPEPNPQDKPQPSPQDKPEPNPQDKPEPNPQDKPGPNPQDKPGPNPQDKPEPSPQDKPEPNPQDKPEPNPQDKPEPNPQDKPGPNPQDKPGPNPQDKPEPNPQDKPDLEKPVPAKPSTKPLPKPQDAAQTQNTDDPKDFQSDDSHDTNLCSGRPVGGVTTLRNGTIMVFRGHYFWSLDSNRVPGPARGITEVWGVPSPIDTVFTRCNCQGKTYIFKGGKYWRFENDVLDPGYPRVVQTGFDGLQGHITGALSVPQYQSRGESVYFFKRGGVVQKYSYQLGTSPACGRKVQYAIYTVRNRKARQAVSVLGPTINIQTSWRGFPSTVTAAVSIPSSSEPEGYKYYVFSRTKSYQVRVNGGRPVVSTPPGNTSSQTNDVFKCPKKV